MADNGNSILEAVKYIAAALSGAAIKPAFDWLRGRRKDQAEAKQIDSTTLQVTDKFLREWVETAMNGNTKILSQDRDIAKQERDIARLKGCLTKILPILEKIPNAKDAVKEAKECLEGK